ncbi:MAG: flagellar biosynthetic protein FliR [Lachnospiraceae bacterium]|nr:flagellar biosynthetic protein FliR [Lachnospiraceae bacterium]
MIDYSFTYGDLEFFLCILVRVLSFIYVAPVFSQRGIPNQVKIGLGIFMSALLYGVIPVKPQLEYYSVWGYAVIIARETLTGLLIGYSASICNNIVDFAGRIMDMESGLSMANLMDPTTGQMSSMSGILYQYAFMLMLLLSGMHRYILRALADTFTLIPVGGAIFDWDRLLQSIITFMGDYVSIGFRICLPMFAVMILMNAVLGIMAKVSPQLNMFAVGMQIKVLVGLCVLFLTAGMLPDVSNFIFTEMKTMMNVFVGDMM